MNLFVLNVKQLNQKQMYAYDIEVAPNFFCLVAINISSDEGFVFEISKRVDQREELLIFLKDKPILFGYNNHMYDDIVLSAIMQQSLSNRQIYNLSCKLINGEDDIKYALQRKYSMGLKSIDLMRLMFAKKLRVSLKTLMVSQKWQNLQDLPFKPEDNIPTEMMDMVEEYCINDVRFTKHLVSVVSSDLKIRQWVKETYKINTYSNDGVSTGVNILLNMYCDSVGVSVSRIIKNRTQRPNLRLRDCILPSVKFNSSTFNNLLDTMRKKTTLELSENVNYNNKFYTYGIGGLHTVDDSDVLIPDDGYIYIDSDVTSYYPSIITQYNLFPEHLSENFVRVYQHLLDKRLEAKSNGDKITSETLKLAINGTFGNLNNEYSWLYDPKIFYTITLSGQLMLTMLCESLEDNGFKIMSANTDGVTALVQKTRYKEYVAICKDWENQTKMKLEYTLFNKIIRRDVNCYYANKCDKNSVSIGSVKEKGDWDRSNKIGKGFDKPIINIALYNYFINGVDVDQTILNHKDIFDFTMSQKVGKQFIVLFDNTRIQQINRYYVSTSKQAGELFKIDDNGKKISLVANESVMLFNKYRESEDYEIDYGYYIREARKIISMLENKQLSLQLI